MAEKKHEGRLDMEVSDGAVSPFQRILLRTRLFSPKLVVTAYVATAASTSILFSDVATTAGIVGILCATASLSGWKRVFPVFMCYIVVFWVTRCSLILAGHYAPIIIINNIGALFASMLFSLVSFIFFIASRDTISTPDGVDDVRLSHCAGAAVFGMAVYAWPLYLSEFRRMPTPIALALGGVITDMAVFAFLARLNSSLVYSPREGTR